MHRTLQSGRLAAALLASGLAVACSGEPDNGQVEPAQAPTQAAVEIPAELIQGTWMVQVAKPGVQDELMGQGPWQQVYNRDYAEAIPKAQGPLLARLHAESAAVYRQAAMLQAQSIEQTFSAEQRRESDPAESLVVLAVASELRGVSGDFSTQVGGELGSVASKWSSPGPAIYPLPEVQSGSVPDYPSAAVYSVKEAVGDAQMDLADPTATLQLAQWHAQAAVAADPQGQAIADALLAPWRLPIESKLGEFGTDIPAELPLEVLFLSSWTSPGDLALASELAAGDLGAVDRHASDSLVAFLLGPCIQDKAVDPQCVVDAAAVADDPLLAAMAAAAGAESVDHRSYARIAQAAVLWGGARAALAAGDERTAALLRINALDRSVDAAQDPTHLLYQASWDASTRNAVRAQELLHQQTHVVPGMDSVRVSLDALHLRVSRDAGPALPMH